VDVLDRVRLLAERDGERRQPNRAAAELADDRAEQLAVHVLEPLLVDREQRERLACDGRRDRAIVLHLRDVADAFEDAVRDARRPTRAPRDLVCCVLLDLDVEDARAPPDDRAEIARLVVIETERHAEAVAQRRRQQAGARRRADKRERRQIERQRARRRALPDDDVQPEVLERGIQDLLDRAVQPVDLVDEQHIVALEARQDRRHVALPFERGARNAADADAELLADDVGEARLPEPGRADEQDVVERLVTRARRLERDRELLLDALLPDEVGQLARPKRLLELFLLERDRGRHHLRHAAFFNAWRTRSSGDASGSVCASTCSASTTDHPSSTSASRATTCGAAVSPTAATSGTPSASFSFSSRTMR